MQKFYFQVRSDELKSLAISFGFPTLKMKIYKGPLWMPSKNVQRYPLGYTKLLQFD